MAPTDDIERPQFGAGPAHRWRGVPGSNFPAARNLREDHDRLVAPLDGERRPVADEPDIRLHVVGKGARVLDAGGGLPTCLDMRDPAEGGEGAAQLLDLSSPGPLVLEVVVLDVV